MSNIKNYGIKKVCLGLIFSDRITIIELCNMLKVKYYFSHCGTKPLTRKGLIVEF
jgi:hypothetical protein